MIKIYFFLLITLFVNICRTQTLPRLDWSKKIELDGDQRSGVKKMEVDDEGNIYLFLQFHEPNYSLNVLKYSPEGELLFTIESKRNYYFETDKNNNIYLVELNEYYPLNLLKYSRDGNLIYSTKLPDAVELLLVNDSEEVLIVDRYRHKIGSDSFNGIQILKYSSDGKIIKENTIKSDTCNTSLPNGLYNKSRAVLDHYGNLYIILEHSLYEGGNYKLYSHYIYKFDSNLELINKIPSYYDLASVILISGNNSLLSNFGSTFYHYSNNLDSYKMYHFDFSLNDLNGVQANKNDILLVGSSFIHGTNYNYDATLVKLDYSRQYYWQIEYDFFNRYDFFSDVFTNGNEIYVTGKSWHLNGGSAATLLKFDTNGKEIWKNVLYIDEYNYLGGKFIQVDNCNNVIVSGDIYYINDSEQVFNSYFFLNKYNQTEIENDSLNSVYSRFELGQNYPNPFNTSTTIPIEIPKNTLTNIKLFDVLGKEIKIIYSGYLDQGKHFIKFDSQNLPSGIYYYRMQTTEFVKTKKTIILK